MKKYVRALTFCATALIAIASSSHVYAQQAAGRLGAVRSAVRGIPHLQPRGGISQLVVDGKPFLMLAGEIGNSSASSLDYMKPHWKSLAKMHLNTVLVPVYWELMEPVQGRFDFTLVDGVIQGARKNDLKIVFLWFGAWKNSMSCYAPEWVKLDTITYPRAHTAAGRALEILSPFSANVELADANAFSALMKHIKGVDETERTVIMMQVENEIGMIPEARDHSPRAEELFAQPVPAELLSSMTSRGELLQPELSERWKRAGMKTTGTWEDVFGKGVQTEEFFMAWWFARYTNAITEAGKKEYPLPMYVNAALNRPNYLPGQYPSAGPLAHLMDIWKAGAPSIDMLCPDIYFKNFAELISRFDTGGNQLFIPEADKAQGAANAFYAIAQHNSLGYSPFSVESIPNPEDNQFTQAYSVLHGLAPLILDRQGKGTMSGVLLDSTAQTSKVTLGNYVFTVRHEYSWAYAVKNEGPVPRVGGMIIMLAPDEFYIAGTGIIVTFEPKEQHGRSAGIVRIDEGSFINGVWVPRRRMNGDEDHQGRHLHLQGGSYGIQRVKLYTY